MEQLKKDIASLEEYKRRLDRQQVSFPLDVESLRAARENVLVPTGKVINTSSLPAFTLEYLEVGLSEKRVLVQLVKES